MQYVCDAPPNTWFRLETQVEADRESREMEHAVERYFRQAYRESEESYVPPATGRFIEQNIGLKAHIQRSMPMFVTLRDREGKGLVTAMLPPAGQDERSFRPIVVGPGNSDPYVAYATAIQLLGQHFKLTLDPVRCYPYRRSG